MQKNNFMNQPVNYYTVFIITRISITCEYSELMGRQLHLLFILSDTQPCLETLRELLSHRITYDRQRHVFEDSKPATFLTACTTPGYNGR